MMITYDRLLIHLVSLLKKGYSVIKRNMMLSLQEVGFKICCGRGEEGLGEH